MADYPLIIFGCSIISYVTGFSLRGTQATINRMALVQVWPGTDRAEVSGIVGCWPHAERSDAGRDRQYDGS